MISLAEARRLCPELVLQEQSQAAEIARLQARIDWFERQVFGASSERRALEILDMGQQLWLAGMLPSAVSSDPSAARTCAQWPSRSVAWLNSLSCFTAAVVEWERPSKILSYQL